MTDDEGQPEIIEEDTATGSIPNEEQSREDSPARHDDGSGENNESIGNAQTDDGDDAKEAEVADCTHDEQIAEGDGVETTAFEAQIAELEKTLDERETRIEELESRIKRKQADFENYKKRQKKRQAQLAVTATEDIVGRLLDVRDNLNRALVHEEDDGDHDIDALREGVEMTLAQLDRVLDSEGVSAIDPSRGEPVDPQRHEVMLRVDSDQPKGAIDEVFQPGYEMEGKVLRAAQVTVSNGNTDEPGDGAENSADDTANTDQSTTRQTEDAPTDR